MTFVHVMAMFTIDADRIPPETITRVRNHGNPVLQISANCSEANTGVAVVGLIANVSKGPRYLVSWDYAISEHRDDVRWRFAVSDSCPSEPFRS